MLIWLCGVSGSGKTSLGRTLYAALKPSHPSLFLLDGDDFRAAMGGSLGYTPGDRAENALRIARFCHLLDSQGIDVVCCAVTMPEAVQSLNREEVQNYVEVHLRVTKDTLLRRDPKGLYKRCLKGEVTNLPGFDIEYTPPKAPHLTLDNNPERTSLAEFAADILKLARAVPA